MARPLIRDALLDAALRELAVLDVRGQLGRGELSSEIDGIAAWRGVSTAMCWKRYKKIRHDADEPPLDIAAIVG